MIAGTGHNKVILPSLIEASQSEDYNATATFKQFCTLKPVQKLYFEH